LTAIVEKGFLARTYRLEVHVVNMVMVVVDTCQPLALNSEWVISDRLLPVEEGDAQLASQKDA
jgi:hypothetical protein